MDGWIVFDQRQLGHFFWGGGLKFWHESKLHLYRQTWFDLPQTFECRHYIQLSNVWVIFEPSSVLQQEANTAKFTTGV